MTHPLRAGDGDGRYSGPILTYVFDLGGRITRQMALTDEIATSTYDALSRPWLEVADGERHLTAITTHTLERLTRAVKIADPDDRVMKYNVDPCQPICTHVWDGGHDDRERKES